MGQVKHDAPLDRWGNPQSVITSEEVERLSEQLRQMDNDLGAQRERAEVAEQEVAYLRDCLECVEAALDGERCAAHQDKQALLERLAHQTTMIRLQQERIVALTRPLSARLLSRVVRMVRR